jgi:hypothetical protein
MRSDNHIHRYLKKILRKNSAAIQAYKKAYNYARQSELKRFLQSQLNERMIFRERLLSMISWKNIFSEPVPAKDEETYAIEKAVSQHNSLALITACIKEDHAECNDCDEILMNEFENNKLENVVGEHKVNLMDALSHLHTFEELSVYRNSQDRANVLLELQNTSKTEDAETR